MRKLIISLHDLHPGSLNAFREQADFCAQAGFPRLSILAIPDYHQQGRLASDEPSVRWLHERQAAGDDIVLHGYYHLRIHSKTAAKNLFWTRFYTANEAEFLDLDHATARKSLQEGLAQFASMGLRPQGFIAPAWLLSASALEVLFDMGFLYTNTISRIIAKGRQWSVRSLCWSTRAAWRRLASLAWNRALWLRLRDNSTVRLSLHPSDLKYPAIRKQIASMLRDAKKLGFEAISYAEWVALHDQM